MHMSTKLLINLVNSSCLDSIKATNASMCDTYKARDLKFIMLTQRGRLTTSGYWGAPFGGLSIDILVYIRYLPNHFVHGVNIRWLMCWDIDS